MPKPSVDDHPTIGEQIEALLGVRDALMLLAKDEYERSIPNNYFLLQYLSQSVDMATSALFATFSESSSPLSSLYQTQVFVPRGFQEPWEWRSGRSAESGATAAGTDSSITVNN